MNETPAPIRTEIKVDGFLIFEKVKHASSDVIREIYRTADIIAATNQADILCNAWPGVEFILYSGLTDTWYSYFRPIDAVTINDGRYYPYER